MADEEKPNSLNSKKSLKKVTIEETSKSIEYESDEIGSASAAEAEPAAAAAAAAVNLLEPKIDEIRTESSMPMSSSTLVSTPEKVAFPSKSRAKKRSVLQFFCSSKTKLRYILSGDGHDEQDEETIEQSTRKGNHYITPIRRNKTNMLDNRNPVVTPHANMHQSTDLLFVLTTTLLIVLAIIAFVFIGALLHYYKKPNPFAPSSSFSKSSSGTGTGGSFKHSVRSLSIMSNIFTHHSHHNFLYYLEKNEEEEQARKEQRENLMHPHPPPHRSSKKRSSSKRLVESRKKSSAASTVQTPCTPTSPNIPFSPPPIIIVNESS